MSVKNEQLDKLFNEQEGLKQEKFNNKLQKTFAKGGINFKSPNAYKVWLAQGHSMGVFAQGKLKNPKHPHGGLHKNDPLYVEYDESGKLVGEAEYDQQQNEYNFQNDVASNQNRVPMEGSILKSNVGPLP